MPKTQMSVQVILTSATAISRPAAVDVTAPNEKGLEGSRDKDNTRAAKTQDVRTMPTNTGVALRFAEAFARHGGTGAKPPIGV